jgi:hypothetical protein
MKHEWIAEALLKFKKVMDKNGVTFWLEYGTQLGAVRDGKMIDWDIDGDVGVWVDDIERMKKLVQEFLKVGILIAYQKSHPFLHILIDKDKGQYVAVVDIYTFDIASHNDKKYLVRIENGIVRDVRSPLNNYIAFRTVKFLGKLFKVPVAAEKALEFAYGPMWKTPIRKAPGHLGTDGYGWNGRTHHKQLWEM